MKRKLLAALAALSLLFSSCAPAPAPEAPTEPSTVPTEAAVEVLAPLPEPEPEPTAAQALLSSMTLSEKVGQLFLACCPDTAAAEQAAELHLGGYVLFARDFEDKTADEVRAMIGTYQDAVQIPLLIAVDEEGGTVTRVSRFPALRESKFLSPQKLFAQGGMEAIAADTAEKCALLKSLGINVNLAPVCDVSTDPNSFIHSRTFGRGTQETAEYVSCVVAVMTEQKLGSALKHFPGYGDNVDTHTGMAWDARPYEQFLSRDFLPFRAGIQAGAHMVMVSHNIVESMDPAFPASLSPAVHDILREELDFEGVIVTDDLSMDGIQDFTDSASAAVAAIQAGNDLLLCADFQTQLSAVLDALADGTLTEAQIDEHALRVLTMKEELGLLVPFYF